MIRRVWSSLPTFREVVFESGMNIVVADRAEESSDKESRNGLGKTTLLRIIQFCLGADFAREKVLSHPMLVGTDFNLDFELAGVLVTATRNTGSPGTVVVTGDVQTLGVLSQYAE